MNTLVQWLKDHKLINFGIWLIYAMLVILPHEWVGLKINTFFKSMPRQQYNEIILIGSLVLLSIVLTSIGKKLLAHTEKGLIFFFFAITIFFIYLTNTYLFVINIESVHYLQYAVAAILIFPMLNSYYATLFWATFMGFIDESYQYFILAPERTDYFDINDIITNFLGVAFGLLILKTLGVEADKRDSQTLKTQVVLPALLLTLFMGILLATNILSVGPSEDMYNIVRVPPPGFWSKVHPNVTYHVVQPLEGLIYMITLFGIYYFAFRSKLVEKS